jgi:DNA polymerase III delta prime subunit
VADFFNLKGSVHGKKLSKNSMLEILDNYQHLINSANNETELLKSIDKKVKSKTFLENINFIESFQNLNNIPVQTIKMLMEKMNLTLSEGKKKVFIFNGIELMKKEGSNAFLKSIEEPPRNTQIILITANLNSILQTIKSRCYLIPFMKRDIDDIKKVFGIVFNKNFDKIDKKKLDDIFSDYSQIIYKKYFFTTINMLSDCVTNIEKKYKILNIITDYSNVINTTIKNSSRQDIFIIKQIFLDIIHLIKMSKNGYDFKNFLDKYMLFLTKFEEEKLYNSFNNILKYFIKYDYHTLSILTELVNKNLNYVFYNNVEIDMTITSYLIRFTKVGEY